MSVDRDYSNLMRKSEGEAASGERHSSTTIATLSGRPLLSNAGMPLDLNWLQEVRVNTSAVERRAQTQVARRTVKKEWQAAWLLRAISCMDLTTLSGDDTEERVRRLCAKARQPIQQDLVQKLGIEELGVKVGAVCVYHTFIETALHALREAEFTLPQFPPDFPPACRRSPSASRKFAGRWKRERMRSMWSSRAPMFSADAGRRSTTRSRRSSRLAARLT